ncbi:MAG: tetratricopeptide repeat protein [Acidobacteriota bacterium]
MPTRLVALAASAAVVASLAACTEPATTENLEMLRARNAEWLGEPGWAQHHFERALAAEPAALDALLGAGRSALEGPEAGLSRAVARLESVLDRSTGARADDGSNEMAGEARRLLAEAHLRLGDTDRALAALGSLSAPEAEVLRARALLDDDPRRGLGAIERALESGPPMPQWSELAARLALRAEEPAAAVRHARTALALDPLRPGASFVLSRALRSVGDPEAERAAIERTERLWVLADATSAPAGDRAVEALKALEALAAADVAVAAAPSVVALRVRLLLRGGMLEAARRELSTTRGSELPSETLAFLAQTAREVGAHGFARQLLARALVVAPEDARLLARAALLAHDAGDLDEAAAMADRALAAQPQSAAARHASGLVALSRGENARAAADLARAVELAPWVATHRATLVRVLWANGDRQAALESLEDAPRPHPLLQTVRRELDA